MQDAIAVGQSDTSKCLVARFDGYTWEVDTSFPDLTGALRGVYALHKNDVWVCGGNGTQLPAAGNDTDPILYHYINGVWVDHSSDLTDCVYLAKIDGNGSGNIWTCGKATGALTTGAWNWNGLVWTSTKQNTIELSNTLYHWRMAVSVSAEGTCFIPYLVDIPASYTGAIVINSNKTVAGFSQFASSLDYSGGYCRKIKAFTDDDIIISNNGTAAANHYAARVYDGLDWVYIGRTSWGSIEGTLVLGALTRTHFYYNSLGDAPDFYKNNNQANGTAIGAFPFSGALTGDGEIGVLADDDIWAVSGTAGAGADPWVTVPCLAHWEGGTTWSVATDYNADGLGARFWYDIAANDTHPSELISLLLPSASFTLDRIRKI